MPRHLRPSVVLLALSLVASVLGACAGAPQPFRAEVSFAEVAAMGGAESDVVGAPEAVRAVLDDGPDASEGGTGPREWHTFGLRAGGSFLLDFDTEVRLTRNNTGNGTGITFEDDLGFTSSTETVRVDAFYRFNRRHRVNASYYDIDRTSTRRIDREIEWGDETFPVNSEVQAFFDTEMLKASYQWTFLPEETWELGASVGLHWMRLETGMSLANTQVSEDFEQDLPLPVVGLHGEWHFADHFRLRGSSEFLWIELSGVGDLTAFDGYLVDNVVAVEWDFLDPVGLGVGYNFFVVDATFESERLSLEARYAYHGVLVYGTLSF